MRSANRFPISRSLPLKGTFTDSDSQHFFANLLPEGNVREQICKSLKISTDNDFELLKAIGGDCAGALTITGTRSSDLQDKPPRYESVTEAQLARWSLGTPNVFAAVTGQSDIRLSLAGAQDKLPVYTEGTQIMIPLGNAPSTHILKFASTHYSHLPENETFITLLAKEVGLPRAIRRLAGAAASAGHCPQAGPPREFAAEVAAINQHALAVGMWGSIAAWVKRSISSRQFWDQTL